MLSSSSVLCRDLHVPTLIQVEAPPATAPADAFCGVDMPLSVFTRLDGICDDCYDLYKRPEVYSLCREDCFGTEFFQKCMRTLIVSEDFQMEAANFLEGISTSTVFSTSQK